MAEAAASGGDPVSAFKPQIIPGIVGGLVGGVAIVLIAAVSKPFLSPEIVQRIGEFGKFLPLPTRLLYGGITEELLLRWGLMTLLVWAAWQAAVLAGVLIGAGVPPEWRLEFAAPLAFIAISIPFLRDRRAVGAALAAGAAILLAQDLPLKLNILVAAVTGIAVGLLLEGRRS